MTKQNFIAMSLPHGLKVLFNKKYQGTLFGQLCGKYNYAEIAFEFGNDRKDLDSCFPILHPLSDLTKEIEHNGEKFVPIERLSKLNGMSAIRDMDTIALYIQESGLNFIPYVIINLLVSWHFDIAGLIEKGEAIDINTIENPYK